ncbi:MAG TPA: 5-oxoprolinase subunit PxpB [Verrucomicrobiales bacterium]|nr:5-oxoprolinase subunit PxpB [Verrucomicrobiales bacterium]
MPLPHQPVVEPLGDAAWLVRWPALPSSNQAALQFARFLSAGRLDLVRDVVPAYASVAVYFPPGRKTSLRVRQCLLTDLSDLKESGTDPATVTDVEIPTYYGGEAGPDLDQVAEICGLTPPEVIARHSAALYTVACIGFSPGFPYLTGLPAELHLPRRAIPRISVPAGSVAIAGGQAGIYPASSPGGWHLIGRTQIPLFSPMEEPPTRLKPGDRVRFVPISD